MKYFGNQFKIHESEYTYLILTPKTSILHTYYMKQRLAWVARLFSYLSSEAVMFALSNRPFRNAGLAFYGLGSLASLGMISDQANAQTLANNSQVPAGITRSDACDHHFKDRSPAGIEKYVECEIREIDKRIAANLKRGAAADQRVIDAERRAVCTSWFIEEIKSSPTRLEAGRTLLGGKSIREVDPCAVYIQLKKG